MLFSCILFFRKCLNKTKQYTGRVSTECINFASIFYTLNGTKTFTFNRIPRVFSIILDLASLNKPYNINNQTHKIPIDTIIRKVITFPLNNLYFYKNTLLQTQFLANIKIKIYKVDFSP